MRNPFWRRCLSPRTSFFTFSFCSSSVSTGSTSGSGSFATSLIFLAPPFLEGVLAGVEASTGASSPASSSEVSIVAADLTPFLDREAFLAGVSAVAFFLEADFFGVGPFAAGVLDFGVLGVFAGVVVDFFVDLARFGVLRACFC